MNTALFLIKIMIFPGLLFLFVYSLVVQWIDRKLYARMQNRVGPPFIQPLADFIKLLSKETIIPDNIDRILFRILPYISFASVITSFLFIPVYKSAPVFSYEGDLIVVAYLLTIPTLVLALAGWTSCSSYSIIGGIRCITQLFAYEVPFFLAILTPGIILETWNIREIADKFPGFLRANPVYIIPVAIAFIVAIISLQGKLERKPFDIPDAETELVAGPFVEYSGRLFAIFRVTIDMEMVAGVSLVAAIFFGGPHSLFFPLGFMLYLLKTLIIVFILAYIKSATARIRIDQMINFGWKILAPFSLAEILLVIVLRLGGAK